MCQDTLRWSGTGNRGALTKVTTSNPFHSKVVDFVRESFVEIQQDQKDWRFMRQSFSFKTVADKDAYGWNELVGDGGNRVITRFDHWIGKGVWFVDDPNRSAYGYVPNIFDSGKSGYHLGELCPITYEQWREQYFWLTRVAQRPYNYAIGPDEKILLGPKPNGEYLIRGEYKPAAHELQEDKEEPQMLPSQYHRIIVWRAVLMINDYDAEASGRAFAEVQYGKLMDQLISTQLPATKVVGAIY